MRLSHISILVLIDAPSLEHQKNKRIRMALPYRVVQKHYNKFSYSLLFRVTIQIAIVLRPLTYGQRDLPRNTDLTPQLE